MTSNSALPDVVSQSEWAEALAELRVKEKAHTRRGDALSATRRLLPMTPVAPDYVFAGPVGAAGETSTLLDLFDGRSQLIVYHFMFGPDDEAGCPGCSWLTDAMTHPVHLHAHDTSLVLVSRAPIEKLTAYSDRMGWSRPWYSSFGSDFNVDMGATVNGDEWHGLSVFVRDGSDVFRSYYTGDRGIEYLGTHWTYLDMTPFGRSESWETSPEGRPQFETYTLERRRDEY